MRMRGYKAFVSSGLRDESENKYLEYGGRWIISPPRPFEAR
jgi:hypothetical protein